MENCMDRYLGQILDNRYEILEVIGSGGMAIVYKALCHRLNRYVAVKVLKDEFAGDEDFREHFRAESQAVAMLSHPNIVSVYDFSKDSHCQYIVMELLEGITLKQYMQKKGTLSWKESLHFATQIAKALSHAHSKGIIHRDIKPQNIMVVKDGSIKVADFGIAHLQNESGTEASETMGSIHYISPEQAHGDPVDARADIYSLGVVMYEMLTGRLPFDGDSVEAIAIQHISQMLTPPGDINPDIPPVLAEITLKSMSADINTRYQSADELLFDLEAFRKSQAFVSSDYISAEENESAQGESVTSSIMKPFFGKGALSEENYARRKVRSRKVSTFSGIALISIFLLVVFSFLWKFWIEDLFIASQRIAVQDFVGQQYTTINDNKTYTDVYNFGVVYAPSDSSPKGEIISQDPEAGRSVELTDEGIDIKLTVSSGVLMTSMPDMVNHEAREATATLTKLGYVVKTETVTSDTITEGYVISTAPVANEQIASGSTVTLSVSGGPIPVDLTMPNLVGKTKSAALAELNKLKIDVGSITDAESNSAVGIVIWQNVTPGDKVTADTVVYLKVSAGQQETKSSTSDNTTSPAVKANATASSAPATEEAGV